MIGNQGFSAGVTLTMADRRFDTNKLFVNIEMNNITVVVVYIKPDSMITRMTNRTRRVDKLLILAIFTIL
jgi:hypothetical protein